MKILRDAGAALSLLAVFGFLASCAFVGNDYYPNYAERLLARTDLDSIVKSASGSSIAEIGGMNYLESSGSSALFVEVRAGNGAHLLLALDGSGLGDAKAYGFDAYGLSSNVGIAASGAGYVSGKALFSAGRALVSDSLPSQPFLLSEAGSNYFLSLSAPRTLQFLAYDSGFNPLSTTSVDLASADNWELVAAAQGGGWYCLLFRDDGSGAYRAFRSPSLAALWSSGWTTLFDDATVPAKYRSGAFRSDYGSAWITADGPVVRSYDNNGTVLTIEPFSGSSSDYSLSNMGDSSFSFGASGELWFMYERKTGQLDEMRTWW